MHISLLCNAGLVLTHDRQTLLVDIPNLAIAPFYGMSEDLKDMILNRTPPYDRVCGFCFTHTHADHCDMDFLTKYHSQWKETPIYYPVTGIGQGSVKIGGFTVSYCEIPHAPMEETVPAHTALLIQAGEKSVYIAGDAVLEPALHREFLNGRKTDAAFWNSMYLSRLETRQLLKEISVTNYIYHMPANHADDFGIWKKCQRNLERSAEELKTVTVLDQYPTDLII